MGGIKRAMTDTTYQDDPRPFDNRRNEEASTEYEHWMKEHGDES